MTLILRCSIDQELYRTQCETAIRETSLELTEKISQQKKSSKKDFTSCWNDQKEKESILLAGVKSREVDLAYEKFAFEKANYGEEFQLKQNAYVVDEKKHALELKEGTKRALMLTLIQAGKGPKEIDEYLTMLNYN